MVNQMQIKYLIFLFVTLLSFTCVQAEKERYIKILDVNNGSTLKTGENAKLTFQYLLKPNDTSFDFILRDEEKKVFEKISTVSVEQFQAYENNRYDIPFTVPQVASAEYLIYAYSGPEDKVSEAQYVKVEAGSKTNTQQTAAGNQASPSINTNSTIAANSTAPVNSASTGVSQANVATAGNTNNSELSQGSKNPFGLKNTIIIGSVCVVILVIFFTLFYCCIKDGKNRDEDVYNLPPSVSQPRLLSSSSPINAIPLNSNQNMGTQQQYNAPIMSPITHSNSNFSDMYQNQETQGLTSHNRIQSDIQSPDVAYTRDTIYSTNSNSNYMSESANQDDDMPSPSPSYYYQVFKPHQVYRVLFDFQPSLPDEMEIQAGDIIRTEETFEDGWAFGLNVTTGKQGTFPLNCLEDDCATEGDKSVVSDRSHSRRVSSLNPQTAQAIQNMLKNNSQSFQKSYYMSQVNNMKV